MRKRLTGALLTAVLIVGLAPATAQAAKPLDVDCAQLEQTDIAFFALAPTFDSLGDLISFFQRDDEAFATASAFFAVLSELFAPFAPIEFASMSQSVSTHSRCGLTPLVISLIEGG